MNTLMNTNDFLTKFFDDERFLSKPKPKNYRLMESDDSYLYEKVVPSLTKDDINIELEDNILNISSEKKEEGDYHWSYRSFSEQITLGNNVDNDNIESSLKNGILSITIPKKEIKSNKKLIEIN